MKQLRKMIKDMNAPYIQSLMKLIETQSKETLYTWTLMCAREDFLPIYEEEFGKNENVEKAFETAYDLLNKRIKLTEAKKIFKEVQIIARHIQGQPAALAAIRAIYCALATFSTPTQALGMVLYGVVAIGYHQLGIDATIEDYKQLDERECQRLENKLNCMAIPNEKNPAKMNWNC